MRNCPFDNNPPEYDKTQPNDIIFSDFSNDEQPHQ